MLDKELFSIDGHEIREGGPVFIIAEAGVNHNQQLDIALQLVDIAAEAGADAVKFQTFKAEQVVTNKGEMATYQKKNLAEDKPQVEMLREYELPEEFYPAIIKRCNERGITFLSTPHGGRASVDFLEELEVPAYKIGSGDLTNYILLEHAAKTGKPLILSSGMANLDEVKAAIDFVKSKGNKQIAVLHCTTNYPTPPEMVNMGAMQTMMQELDVPVGYSDHTEGIEVAVLSAKLGAAVYEGHFTVDKTMKGPDHKASASPEEFKARVAGIRNPSSVQVPNEQALMGSGEKVPFPDELDIMPIARRSIVYTDGFPSGHGIKPADLEAKRPGDGTSPMLYESFLSKTLTHDVAADDQLSPDDFA